MPELRTVAVETASDAELIRLVLRKDEAAARALMQRYNRRLYRVARGVVRDDGEAEDVLQEAYLRAFSALAVFRGSRACRPGSLASCSTRRFSGCAAVPTYRFPTSTRMPRDAAPKSFLSLYHNQRSIRSEPWRNNSSVSSSNERSTRFRASFVPSSSPGLSKA